MTIGVKTGIFTGIAAVAALAGVGCSGGSNRIDSSLPPPNVLNNLAGVYRKFSISGEGRSITCPNPNETLLGTPVSELTVNGVVVDSCGPTDILILGPTDVPGGTGRYRIVTRAGTEDGDYRPTANTLVLTRDMINGRALASLTPSQRKQRIVLSARFNADGSLTLTPAAQATGYRATGSPTFFDNGRLNTAAITPLTNSDGSINVIVLPNSNDVAHVNSDLSITVGPVADSTRVIEPPGIPEMRGTTSTFVKQEFAPDETPPTPAPKP